METSNEKTFKCLNCGKETTSKRNNIFCSNECYLEFRKRPNQIIEKEQYAELIIRSIKYGIKHIVIDLEDVEKCKNYKWFLSFDEILNSFYVKTSKYPYSLHRVIMNCPKGFVVDHINHNTLDNRKENLRICTHAENMKNRKRVRECVNCIDLKRQNEELQKENKKYSLFIEKLCDYTGLECDDEEQAMRTLSDLASQMNKARWIIYRYKQTLTEIKEIAENMNKECFYDDFDCMNCDMQNGCTYFNKKQILQKISEVENKYNTKDIRHINEKNQEYIAEGNRMTKMNSEQKERLIEKIEYDIKSDMIAQEEKKKIKRSECPYGGIDCAWCVEDCE